MKKIDNIKKINPISWYKKPIEFIDFFISRNGFFLNQKMKKWDWFLDIKNRSFLYQEI